MAQDCPRDSRCFCAQRKALQLAEGSDLPPGHYKRNRMQSWRAGPSATASIPEYNPHSRAGVGRWGVVLKQVTGALRACSACWGPQKTHQLWEQFLRQETAAHRVIDLTLAHTPCVLGAIYRSHPASCQGGAFLMSAFADKVC